MLLEAKHLIKRLGHHVAVNDLSLQIEKGSFTALLGPNGAGKSTTMSMLTGLSIPTAGQIILQKQTKVGVVFQSSVLDDRLTVEENLRNRAKQYRHIDIAQVGVVSHQLGLTEFLQQDYGTLSGGQKRRVDIARALLNTPDILFLDEPTTGLDVQTRSAIWDLLHQLQSNCQLTIVLTTHYLDEADTADCVYIVDHGQLLARGTAAEIKEKFAMNKLTILSMCPEQLLANTPELPINVSNNWVTFQVPTTSAALDILFRNRQLVEKFEFHSGTMNDAFLALTGREMR
ncbi:ABC transporter ATP-binding protein [Levilactobacillus tujiorum]|uniref:ABC transporter ATP-binding protein n=1 Tax=Levilactobacillus tujiorum TaxID=2912243 RepID=A0ABX1L0W2_9LACO|nr:ABC transporter ATP-binding protein [Levilactobacillus tujiorum]MCH5463673.1 ABC transporter ATP-binding protein [Levilactobacillus tujiorum]NLR10878.1 ABC transporter ATP-binding protein [Lactobacillus sp. HBUAS51387]NLR28660.1 ABC transporter ATP-binding protein [Levilactobacillus tujiorum]